MLTDATSKVQDFYQRQVVQSTCSWRPNLADSKPVCSIAIGTKLRV